MEANEIMVPESTFEKAVFEALVYFELFHFVPTVAELHRLVGVDIDVESFEDFLLNMEGIVYEGGYVSLKGSEDLIRRRQGRHRVSILKIMQGQRWGKRLGRIAGVRAVFLTGSVAAGNGFESDDLDFLIVTSAGRLWLVRLLLFLAIQLWNPDVDLCLNYLVAASDGAMQMDRNLYVATELALMVPVYDEGYYTRFMRMNEWRYEFRPNSFPYPVRLHKPSILKRVGDMVLSFPLFSFLDWLEMKRAIARMRKLPWNGEVVGTREVYKGHFSGHRTKVLSEFKRNLHKLFNKNDKIGVQ